MICCFLQGVANEDDCLESFAFVFFHRVFKNAINLRVAPETPDATHLVE
jgi:hypothetical protein